MSGGVAVILALLGVLLILVAVKGTYADVMFAVAHPPTSEKTQGKHE